MSGEIITNSMKPMHDRSNGLGGGFAGYGIYPEYKEFYALHMFFDCRSTRKECEAFLKERFEIVQSEVIPTRSFQPLPMSRLYGDISSIRSNPFCPPFSWMKKNLLHKRL